MLNELRAAGLPVQPCSVAVGERVLERLAPDLPAVVKVGNYHGGLGKARAADEEQWVDIRDLTFATEDYFTIEPYIAYDRDLRCLAVGDEMWAMARRGVSWKVNVQTAGYELIPVPDELRGHTERALAHFGADVLGLDFLQMRDGAYVLLESNDTPGFSGFPAEVRVAVARRLRDKLEAV
jgi:ribosomal protein S6--L-glutamate ligase